MRQGRPTGLDVARFVADIYRRQFDTWWAGEVRHDLLARLRRREGRENPYPIYEELRSHGIFTRTYLGNIATTSHQISHDVLHGRRFGVRTEDGLVVHGGVRGNSEQADISFLGLNPPDHSRLRRLAAPAFSPRMMAAYSEMIEKTVHGLLDAAEPRESFDLVDDFAAPLPIAVISEMLGVPDADVAGFRRYGMALASALDGVHSLSHARRLLAARGTLDDIFERLLVLRAEEPREDLVSTLVAAQADSRMTAEEFQPMCHLLLVAGFETTVNLISNAVLALKRTPGAWDGLLTDPAGLAPAAVEETLRWDPPVQRTTRVSFDDTELGGVPVEAGTWIVTLIGGANRDPDFYERPSRFELSRYAGGTGPEHLAFSGGVHYCIGAPLARLEATVALRALAERLPKLKILGPPVMRPATTVRGPASLPVASH